MELFSATFNCDKCGHPMKFTSEKKLTLQCENCGASHMQVGEDTPSKKEIFARDLRNRIALLKRMDIKMA